jgi:acyl-lipid omega-6 desaturase (Delta-12 desaturase)
MADTVGREAAKDEATTRREWSRALSQYEKPNRWQAIRQLLNTVLPYVALWAAMVWMLRAGLPYWTILPLLIVAAGLLVRVFIIFHDCCHGSFFPSKIANRVWGYLTGILTFTPYEGWQHPHNLHHASAGDLDRRGTGDVWTMTVDEYRNAPWRKRVAYRIFRNPLVLFVVGPTLLFLVSHRFQRKGSGPRERRSVVITNLSLLAIAILAHLTIGLGVYLAIQVPIMAITGSVGVWLFYVQHQYEEVYWSRHAEWDPARAALEGSSYYELPRMLEWFTGSIGFHYLHHLRPRIPNYLLRQCSAEMPVVPGSDPLTLRGASGVCSCTCGMKRRRSWSDFPSVGHVGGCPDRAL